SALASSLIPIGRPPSARARNTRAALSTAGTGRSTVVLSAIRVRLMVQRGGSGPLAAPDPIEQRTHRGDLGGERCPSLARHGDPGTGAFVLECFRDLDVTRVFEDGEMLGQVSRRDLEHLLQVGEVRPT